MAETTVSDAQLKQYIERKEMEAILDVYKSALGIE